MESAGTVVSNASKYLLEPLEAPGEPGTARASLDLVCRERDRAETVPAAPGEAPSRTITKIRPRAASERTMSASECS